MIRRMLSALALVAAPAFAQDVAAATTTPALQPAEATQQAQPQQKPQQKPEKPPLYDEQADAREQIATALAAGADPVGRQLGRVVHPPR